MLCSINCRRRHLSVMESSDHGEQKVWSRNAQNVFYVTQKEQVTAPFLKCCYLVFTCNNHYWIRRLSEETQSARADQSSSCGFHRNTDTYSKFFRSHTSERLIKSSYIHTHTHTHTQEYTGQTCSVTHTLILQTLVRQ